MARRHVVPEGYPKAVALGVAVILLALGWGYSTLNATPPASAGVRSDAGGAEWLNVSVNDALQFVLNSPNEVTPGDLVHVVITQTGTVAHTFTLSPSAGYEFDVNDDSAKLLAYFSSHPPLVNVQVGTTLNGHYYGNFTAPPLGEYEYVCTEPGHFPGMSGLLGSGEAGGTAAQASTGPGATVFIIVGVIVALVILALVLGFVVGQRRGAHEEMVPERLGYPEVGPSAAAPPIPPSGSPPAPPHP